MTTPLDRSGDAALRVLAARDRGAEIAIVDLELAAWTAGKAGLRPPRMSDAKEDLHVRQAAAFGRGNDDAAFALIASESSAAAGDRLLFHACHLVGDRWPDRLIEIAEGMRGVWFRGPLLVRTHDPLRLLALVDAENRQEHVVSTICELVIRGRDVGARQPRVEQRWAELNEPGKTVGYIRRYREAELRLAARENMEYAIERHDELAASSGYDGQPMGTEAVLARLVRSNPERACEIVASREEAMNRISWLHSLVRWHELPVAAEAIVDELLARESPDGALALARALVLARSPQQLERALARIVHEPPMEIATATASAVARLRDAGLHDDAELARERVLAIVSDAGARELFEALSAPDLAPLVPWLPDPGLP